MDILYRLFYTVFSMSCMIVVLTPFVLLLRFLLRKLPRKFSVALWTIFYFRAICPVGMSSPICLFGKWNRQFHILLRSIGLKMIPDRGLMTGWRCVYQSQLEVTVPYVVCTVLWILGIVGVLLFTWKKQRDVRKELGHAVLLFDNVYQSERIQSPIRTGIFRRYIYLPDGLSAKELKSVLIHQQMHCEKHDDWLLFLFFIISCIHWWNPCIWLAYYLAHTDREVFCDEAVVQKIGWSAKADYAQDILNMKKGEERGGSLNSLVSFQEKNFSSRAEHVLYMEHSSVLKKAGVAFLLTVCLFCWFVMSALSSAWNGGQWRETENIQEEAIFPDTEERGITNEVIASCESQTPEGTSVTLELLMTQGTYLKGRGYTGQCVLRMRDEGGKTLASLTLSRLFTEEKVQQFGDSITLSVDDYNEDGVMEVSLGQKMKVTASKLAVPATKGAVVTRAAIDKKRDEKKAVYGYYLINLESDQLRVISDFIYLSEVTELQAGSTIFSYIEDAEGIITTQIEGKTAYYVWDKQDKMYYRQNITQEEINARTAEKKNTVTEGETNAYSLKNKDEQIVVRVATRTDDTGGQSIENVIMNPKGIDRLKGLKTLTNIHGYFNKIEWAPTVNQEEEQRYAVLTYTGIGAQTFVIYDVERRRLHYRQEDSNKTLASVFEEFDQTDISFSDDDMVVYSLMEIRDNGALKIGFAANAKGEIIVRGSYLCNISNGKNSNLQFTQELE